MKTILKNVSVIALIATTLFSCNNDDDGTPVGAAPVINNFEYGEGSTHSTDPVAYKGADIHLEADITAENIVSSITIDIHAHDLTPAEGEVEWDYENVYTDADYQVINPTFHEHIDVPANIPAGEYHMTLTVIDELGNSTEVEGHIDILDYISVSDLNIDSSVARGSDFHAEFMIDAVNGIHGIDVDIHAHDIVPGAGEVEWDYENEFTTGYHGETEVEFHEHIDVPANAPAGEYHITFTIEDEDGNTHEFETHIDVTE
ncbi:DUF4625 domain-containing protein [Neptunitalea lumnitzerae]|uniref:DUF4625 domain-containing protein n=1 Tax=Neptunitalea lumnitzerae TaxID=2965509 RepID=A0ABQ5MJM1_9FLAO|nr:DUF4625 domain-containing protein [Neptunitalea sp. Y10]GLB49122.1 hypothetical protein Y10_14900 [Neptunitalea sp. Y10]